MPELPEVEGYRRLAEAVALDRPINAVVADDAWYLKRGLTAFAAGGALVGRTLVGARRRGKLMLVDTSGAGPVVGLRFGMSGRLVVDGRSSIDRLQYSPAVAHEKYDRFALCFADGGALRMRDPRRLGGVELDPDEDRLGPDALGLTTAQLRAALTGSDTPLKARLLDQARIAGIGNLIADEVLWRAGLSPLRPAGGLTDTEVRGLARSLRSGLGVLMAGGGSHTGDLMAERHPGGHCPRDGAELQRATVGGRTSYWCPLHQ